MKLGHSQNPLGIYIDIDGTLKFWEYEANLNGNLEDTVFENALKRFEVVHLDRYFYWE